MTISQLEVDFSGCFEVGQAYVALSRATSLQGLRLKVRLCPHIAIIQVFSGHNSTRACV